MSADNTVCDLCNDAEIIYQGPDPKDHSKRVTLCPTCIQENDVVICLDISAEETHIEALKADNDRLRVGLETALEYARHSEGCSASVGENYYCKCRWAVEGPIAKKALEKKTCLTCGGNGEAKELLYLCPYCGEELTLEVIAAGTEEAEYSCANCDLQCAENKIRQSGAKEAMCIDCKGTGEVDA